LLADEMGLGKTVQAIRGLAQLFAWQAICRVLVVCPVSLLRNWRREIHRWAPAMPAVIYEGGDRYGMLEGHAPLLIGSYDTVVGDLRRKTSDGSKFADIGLDVIVLDEAQRIKSPSGLGSRVLSRLVAARRWAITGTPLENHPRELSSILRFLFPNEFDEESSLDDAATTLALRDRCLVRRLKSQVASQLPSKTVVDTPIELLPEQAAEYSRVCLEVTESVKTAATRGLAKTKLLGGLQALRRIAAISRSGESSKIDFVADEVEELADRDEKVVIFSSFPNLVFPHLARRLEVHGTVQYTGKMSLEERECAHRSFMEDPAVRVMCASLKAAGTGLTWTVASHVYHMDIWWNPQVLRQAEDRVHRIGQTKPVLVKRLYSDGTIEQGIIELLLAKQDLFDFLIEEKSGDANRPRFFEQLLALIGLKMGDLRSASG